MLTIMFYRHSFIPAVLTITLSFDYDVITSYRRSFFISSASIQVTGAPIHPRTISHSLLSCSFPEQPLQ
jgi:hypothetical protein